MKEEIQTVRGMHDLLPGRSLEVSEIEGKARELFGRYGYQEIRTPVMESVSLFERALGQATDIVQKEMFTLKDRGERVLCLRPEGTAGVVRAYIEHGLNQKLALCKLFYIGAMFRAERPQAGRFREFIQIGSEYFGNLSPSADAETILLVSQLLVSAGLESFEVQLNSIGCEQCRPEYQKLLLQFLKQIEPDLCENCRQRIVRNPLRVLDCKSDRDKFAEAPSPSENLCQPCEEHFIFLQELLAATGVKFRLNPRLVRGLDYYTRTVFEVYAVGKEGSQDALAAGGRYDALVSQMGGDMVPAVGFALGVERVVNAIYSKPVLAEEFHPQRKGVFVAALGKEAVSVSFKICTQLRQNGCIAEGVFNGSSLKSQMRLADSLAMRFCAIIGENEIKDGMVSLKDLEKKSQIQVPFSQLIEAVKNAQT